MIDLVHASHLWYILNFLHVRKFYMLFCHLQIFLTLTISKNSSGMPSVSNSLNLVQVGHFVWPDLG